MSALIDMIDTDSMVVAAVQDRSVTGSAAGALFDVDDGRLQLVRRADAVAQSPQNVLDLFPALRLRQVCECCAGHASTSVRVLLGFSIEKTLTQHRRADFLGFSGGQGGGVAVLQSSGQG